MFRGRGFVFAQDSIAEFVRTLDHPYQVAFYSYSRDFYRAASLTTDRSQVLRGVRETVNGDDSALYNALLMTLKDAAQYSGRKVVVVFSNGPDNSSMVSPEDVDELAQSEGVPIYMISTREAKLDAASAAVFSRMTASTGGEAYFAKSWKDQRDAFSFDPGRPCASVFYELLPAAESKSRVAHDHGETHEPEIQEVPHPHAQRLSPHPSARQHRRCRPRSIVLWMIIRAFSAR